MENASKALLIAGGSLIAILLLTLFAYLFGKMAESSSKIYDMMDDHDKSEFNQQFLNYEKRGVANSANSNPLTIQDVVTIINLARDNNKSKSRPTKVTVEYTGSKDIMKTYKTDITNDAVNTNDLLKKYVSDKFKCTKVYISSETELVYKIVLGDY